MPFKSEAQRRKFAKMLAEGKISQEVFDAWDKDTDRMHIPDRVEPEKKLTHKPFAKIKSAKVIK